MTTMHAHVLPPPAEPGKGTERSSCLFHSIEFFVSKLSLRGIKGASDCFESCSESIHSPQEIEEYNRVKCSLVMDVLKFVGILSDYRHDDDTSVCV